jgi:formate hydrogenlyase subunit 3/multisubunit Na+/H+ antiporter MnhD subunit
MNAIFSVGLLLLGVIWPLLLTLMLAFKGGRSLALHLSPWAALPALVASLLVTPSDMRWNLSGVLFGSELGLDATGQVFLLLTALIWTVAGIYARTYFPQPEQRTRFYVFFMLAMAGNFGLILAQDLPSFYFSFSLMSFAAYGLVVFKGDVAALRAGRVYIILVVIGELMLFAAMLMATQATDAITFDAVRIGLIDADNRDWVIFLALVGFGIKVGVISLHVWLPLAHPVAPTPASAVLSGAMLKAGLLGWLRFLPMGEMALPEWGSLMIVLGFSSAFYAVVIGLTQRDPKTLLAYSSISQMGILTLTVGLGMLAPQAWPVILPGIAFYALHHGLSKGALFLGVGLSGSHHPLQRRWVWIGLCLPALALAGAPWTSGMLAKDLVKTYSLYAPTPWNSLLPILLSASAVATALLMARLLYLIRPAAQPFGLAPVVGLVWPWTVLLLSVLLAPWWLGYSLPEQAVNLQIIKSLWPILLAFFVMIIVLKMNLFQSLQPVPAGDILVFLEQSFQPVCRIVRKLVSILYFASQALQRYKFLLMRLVEVVMARIQMTEKYFTHWSLAISLVMMIAVGISLMASLSLANL